MSKELHIALQEAIGDLGTDVLKSPHLVNILQDYGAFDVHDKDISLKKEIISALVTSGYGEKIIRWKKEPNWESENKKCILSIKKKYSFNEETLHEISNVFIHIGGLRVNSSTQKSPINRHSKQQSQKQKIAVRYINKVKKHIPQIADRGKLFRMILYIITVWNVIQLLAAFERVTTWGVWDGIIILPAIGVLGVLLGLLLPAFGLSAIFYNIEINRVVNHRKIIRVLFILNLIGISGLFVLSKMTYGSSTEQMWSWHHVWLILRPFVFIIGGITACVIVILILWGVNWLLVQTGRALIKYFTT